MQKSSIRIEGEIVRGRDWELDLDFVGAVGVFGEGGGLVCKGCCREDFEGVWVGGWLWAVGDVYGWGGIGSYCQYYEILGTIGR